MKQYKLQNSLNGTPVAVGIVGQEISIPFDPANTDYANFKKEVLEGAELQDADGNVMSAKAAQEFIKELP
jgi:hypothetical protein